MKGVRALAFFAMTSCGGAPPAPPSPAVDPALHKKFFALMENTEKQFDAILEDLQQNRGEPSVKKRLSMIRQNSEAARGISYFKDEEENRELREHFENFLITLAELEVSPWDRETGQNLWKRLQFRCSVCHARFRE